MDYETRKIIEALEKRFINLKNTVVYTSNNIYECQIDTRKTTKSKKHCIWNSCDKDMFDNLPEDGKIEINVPLALVEPNHKNNISWKLNKKWYNIQKELDLYSLNFNDDTWLIEIEL